MLTWGLCDRKLPGVDYIVIERGVCVCGDFQGCFREMKVGGSYLMKVKVDIKRQTSRKVTTTWLDPHSQKCAVLGTPRTQAAHHLQIALLHKVTFHRCQWAEFKILFYCLEDHLLRRKQKTSGGTSQHFSVMGLGAKGRKQVGISMSQDRGATPLPTASRITFYLAERLAEPFDRILRQTQSTHTVDVAVVFLSTLRP